MARYDCKCDCGYMGEIEKSMDEPYPYCPVCGKRMERLFTGMSFILRGEGWSMQGYEKPNAEMQKYEKEHKSTKPTVKDIYQNRSEN